MFIQSFLSYNYDVKDSYLSAEGFCNETISEVTATEVPAQINQDEYSLRKRRNLVLNGKKV